MKLIEKENLPVRAVICIEFFELFQNHIFDINHYL